LQALLLGTTLAAVFSAAAQAPTTAPTTAPSAMASPAAPRALSYADTDAWRTIATPTLSNDGAWLAYSVQPQRGDGQLVLRERSSGKERREAVGMLPPPVTTPNTENPDAPPPPRAIRVVFSSDSRFLVASTNPMQAETLAARKARTRPDDMPKGGLLIVDLKADAPALRVPRVKSLALPSKGGAWLAYLREAEPAAPARPAAAGSAPAAAPAAARAPAAGAAAAMDAILSAVATGALTTDEAEGVAKLVQARVQVAELAALEQRMEALERAEAERSVSNGGP
jgi:hypothetical protein